MEWVRKGRRKGRPLVLKGGTVDYCVEGGDIRCDI